MPAFDNAKRPRTDSDGADGVEAETTSGVISGVNAGVSSGTSTGAPTGSTGTSTGAPTRVANGTSTPTLYLAAVIHSISLTELEVLPSALICVVGGKIEWFEKDVRREDLESLLDKHGVTGAEVTVLDEGFLCPGFVDTHTHAPQYPNNGLGSELELLDWLDRLTFPSEAKFEDLKVATKVYEQVVRRNLAAGTTTACYYGTLHVPATRVLADLCNTLGQRAFVGRCSMNRFSPDYYVEPSTEASMASTEAYLSHFPTCGRGDESLVQPILTPRFALSCTPDLLSALGSLARERDLPIQTHLCENTSEIAEIKRLFPHCKTYAAAYADHGLLTRKTILAHAVHLDDAERDVIAAHGAGVSHCPTSNTNLNSGSARVVDMLGAGIRVGLGTDCSGGPSLGILPIIRAALAVSRALFFEGLSGRSLTIQELFYMATMGGAEITGLKGVGNFEAGSQFDALHIKPRSPGLWVQEDDPLVDVFEKWVFCGDDRDVARVWVRGRCVAGVEAGLV